MNNTGLIIKREYLERVNKKSFIVTTLLVPVVMLALMVLPTVLMFLMPSSTKNVAVIDDSGIILPQLKSNDNVTFFAANAPQEQMLSTDSIYGVLIIDRNILANNNGVRLLTPNAASTPVSMSITEQMEKIIETEKLKNYNIENLDEILKDVKTSITLQSIRVNDADDQGEAQSAELNSVAGIALNFVLYMFLLMYGALVMNSIVEEKGNRVLELVVSSVKPMQLMMGKIIGVGLVAFTQIAIWAVIIVGACSLLLPAIVPADVMAEAAAVNAGTVDVASANIDVDLAHVLSTFSNVPYLLGILGLLILFLICGYMLYAAIFAAIGAATDDLQDSSQLQLVGTMPIMVGLFASMVAVTDPDGIFAVVMSLIPFTSPMVMMARVPFGIPGWQIALSLVLLVLTVFAMIWLAGKIYRVGIFMYGKKPSFRDLARWVTYK
ncbi:MAG: ABC transporter permease [Bacteroides sp.]|nr:ABC transporter permease [Bacteroides sp.]MCM1380184.1 ABC transporter permease [Bacteroides sp.]MCM1446501.1 ABC transporter permease [Prevotella sp.]